MLSHRQLFLQHLAQTTDFPLQLEIERAEGIYMYTPEGKEIIDLISGIGVSNIGHRHPKVVKAIKDQADKYLHLMVYGELVQAPQVQLAAKIKQTLPADLDSVYLVNSGAEAVEGALKLAKRYTGRAGIVAFKNAYHGSTQGALSVTGGEDLKRAYRPLLPMIQHLRPNNFADLDRISCRTACVILETIQGEAGIRIPEMDWMQALREKYTTTGSLLILDEIQTGFGRTGSFWAFEHYGIEPDILLCAKGMGGGMPIGAFISNASIMRSFRNDPMLGHITTFGGHPVSSAAALATLEVLLEEDLISQVQQKAELFKQKLQHPKIKAIRHKGLLMCAEFGSFEILKPIIDKAIEKGVLTDWFLFCDNSMRIAPPLTINAAEIEKACAIIVEAINEAG